jgi:hypothetical protein
VLQQLTLKWCDSFETAARAGQRKMILNLFSPDARLCGTQKDGPLDRIQGPNFHFERDSSRVFLFPPYALQTISWHATSPIHGGPTRKGDCTFFFEAVREEGADGATHNLFLCHHAHFSEIA